MCPWKQFCVARSGCLTVSPEFCGASGHMGLGEEVFAGLPQLPAVS